MKLKPHPRYPVFRTWFDLHRADAIPIAGEYYRVAGPRYTAATEILQGTGAYKGGGRWNPPEVMNVVYLSAEPETAMREANENLRYYGVALWKGMPKVTVAVRVETVTTLDLTDPKVAAHLPEPMANLLAEDWRAVMARGNESTTQAMGRAAFDAGLQGLRVPSKADPNGVNLLVFPARLTKRSRLQVVNPTDLEKLGKPT